MRAFLAGEGKHELGGWFDPMGDHSEPGLIEGLARRIRPNGWSVCGAIRWMKIRKFRANHRSAEARNLRGAHLMAQEAGCDALLFVRDEDGDPNRAPAIEAGIRDCADGEGEPTYPLIGGGLAVPTIDAWCLALQGVRGSELEPDAKGALKAAGIGHTAARVQLVADADWDELPPDAPSLHAWIGSVTAVLW